MSVGNGIILLRSKKVTEAGGAWGLGGPASACGEGWGNDGDGKQQLHNEAEQGREHRQSSFRCKA